MRRSTSEYVYVLRASTSDGRSGVWSACRAWTVRTDSPERSASRAIKGAASGCSSPNAWMLLATRKTRATRIGVGSNRSRKRMSAPRVNARRTRKNAAVTAEQRSAASSPTWLTTEPIDRSGMRHPVAVPSARMPRMPEPKAVMVRAPAPRRDVPGPTEIQRVEVDVRHAFHLHRRRPGRYPDPSVIDRVDPLARRIGVDERRRLCGWGRRRGLSRWGCPLRLAAKAERVAAARRALAAAPRRGAGVGVEAATGTGTPRGRRSSPAQTRGTRSTATASGRQHSCWAAHIKQPASHRSEPLASPPAVHASRADYAAPRKARLAGR